MLEVIERDLANDDLTPSQHGLLNEAAARVQKLAETGHECADRGETTDGLSGDCSDLVRGEYFATGVLSYAPRGDLEGLESGEMLFSPSGYEYREGRYDGPLFVLQNRGTASAAEYFAAVLKDNGAATLIGSRTVGVGCGYTNGGLDVVLSNSNIRVWMPDCVRLRPDGSNEADGVAPDVEAGWSDDDSNTELAAKVVSVLERLSTPRALQ